MVGEFGPLTRDHVPVVDKFPVSVVAVALQRFCVDPADALGTTVMSISSVDMVQNGPP